MPLGPGKPIGSSGFGALLFFLVDRVVLVIDRFSDPRDPLADGKDEIKQRRYGDYRRFGLFDVRVG